MKQLKDDPRVIEIMDRIHFFIEMDKLAAESKEEKFELNNPDSLKYYLIFYDDHGNREDCSTYYSHLVIAKNSKEAINKFIQKNNLTEDEYYSRYTFERMEPII